MLRTVCNASHVMSSVSNGTVDGTVLELGMGRIRLFVQVFTIDTNPPPAFTRCAANMLNAECGMRSEPVPEVALS